MESKLVIRQFYEDKIRNNYEDNICDIFQVKFEIGSAGFNPQDTFKKENINIQEFAKKALQQEVPTAVLSAFKRHIWYAKHGASEIRIFKIPVNKDISYAICINGYVDDGWDNHGNFIEVYNEQGQLMGSKVLCIDEEDWENWIWMDRPLQSKDFNSYTPPWLEEGIC